MSPAKRAPALSSAEFHILLALADGPKHGHGIKLDVRDRTEGAVAMGPGTLYTAIKRLVGRGQIEETDAPKPGVDEDERRRYYELTPAGLEGPETSGQRVVASPEVAIQSADGFLGPRQIGRKPLDHGRIAAACAGRNNAVEDRLPIRPGQQPDRQRNL